jgi:hypothetical protein
MMIPIRRSLDYIPMQLKIRFVKSLPWNKGYRQIRLSLYDQAACAQHLKLPLQFLGQDESFPALVMARANFNSVGGSPAARINFNSRARHSVDPIYLLTYEDTIFGILPKIPIVQNNKASSSRISRKRLHGLNGLHFIQG